MKVEFINPFANAAFGVISKETGWDLQRRQLALKPSPIQGDDVNVILGITGDVEGQVLYTMNLASAKAVSSKMLGESVSEFDELAKSAIAELSNIITGNAAIGLSNNGYSCTITPPTMFTGSDLVITTAVPILVIPLTTEDIEIRINVALREKR